MSLAHRAWQAVAFGTLTGHKHPHSAITQKETGERAPEVLVVKEQLPVCELESGLCESLMSGCFMQLLLGDGCYGQDPNQTARRPVP